MDGGGVIVTVTLNAGLSIAYETRGLSGDMVNPVTRPRYRAIGRGIEAARVLRAFGHDVLAAGFAGGESGELLKADLARSGVPTALTQIRAESRRIYSFSGPDAQRLRFGEPGPYITTEELGRFAAGYRELLPGAVAVVLSGGLPDGLPPEMYGTLVTYAAEAAVPVIIDAGGEELLHAAAHGPDLVIADTRRTGGVADLGDTLVRLGAGAAAVVDSQRVGVISASGRWAAHVAEPGIDVTALAVRGALVAGMVPGQLLGWTWPERLRHALGLAAAHGEEGDVNLADYERLVDAVVVAAAVHPLADS